MAYDFADKLDRIMAATRTSNTALARAVSFDASYICRIRNGKRGLPIKQPFIKPAAAYLAGRVCDDRTRRAVSAEIGSPWPEDASAAEMLLESWLADAGTNADNAVVQQFFDALETPISRSQQKAQLTTNPTRPSEHDFATKSVFFYGNEGKRAAVLEFLSQLIATNEQHTLLLHSDEDMTWLYEDEDFARQWGALMATFAANGGRVRIIHSISRDANEMWEAARKWLPLYATGVVEPYYYPLLRDGIYCRTLFIAPGHSAIVATSVGEYDGSGKWLNALVYDKQAVVALEHEFEAYFVQCRPLMRIHSPEDAASLARIAAEFANGASDMLASLQNGKLICARKDGRALLANFGPTFTAFETVEARMAGTIWGYLRSMPAKDVHRGEAARKLIDSLQRD